MQFVASSETAFAVNKIYELAHDFFVRTDSNTRGREKYGKGSGIEDSNVGKSQGICEDGGKGSRKGCDKSSGEGSGQDCGESSGKDGGKSSCEKVNRAQAGSDRQGALEGQSGAEGCGKKDQEGRLIRASAITFRTGHPGRGWRPL